MTATVQNAIRDVGCIEPLVRLLETKQSHVRNKVVDVLNHVARNGVKRNCSFRESDF